MVSFAGFEMPVQYPLGILQEHHAVREKVGVFDVSHMGEFEVRGSDSLAFLQKLTINDVTKLTEGKAQYSAMCYENGGIVDDLLIYHCGDYYMMVVNGACLEKDWAWATKTAAEFADLELRNVSDDVNLLAIQGPKSLHTLQKLTTVNLRDIQYYHHLRGSLADIPMILSRTGYTGETGMELYFRGDEKVATQVWREIFSAGKEFGIEPIGLGARDTLRLEKGYCLYGNDITDQTNPLEAGLGWITKLSKGEFIGGGALRGIKTDGITRKLVGFQIACEEKFIPRAGYPISINGETVGSVTSGNISPMMDVGIGLGYVPISHSEPGSEIFIAARGKLFEAIVEKLPMI